MGNSFFRRFIF